MTDAHLSIDGRTLTVRVPMTFRTRGGRKLVISPGGVPSWVKSGIRIDNTMVCPSSKHLGHVILFPMGGSGSSRFDVMPLVVDGSSGVFGWSVS